MQKQRSTQRNYPLMEKQEGPRAAPPQTAELPSRNLARDRESRPLPDRLYGLARAIANGGDYPRVGIKGFLLSVGMRRGGA